MAFGELLGQQEASLRPFMESLRSYSPFFGPPRLSGRDNSFALDYMIFEKLTFLSGKILVKERWKKKPRDLIAS
ncbi:hypothetical protein TDIS_1699 [Thermosulfurimonas dismutans]|uniref:Uncharacterized protein n=1 Tax=Thermosulfurimonas dismutans TaxID=999894 RepID=A0A179D2B7_9BACT|nr:hypothetical protein TDIS_1699 [Thermosulfurimonas dismutans]